jgi:ribosomal protein L37E
VIFRNPSGAPELACDECGCRWFDRMTGACYECGAPIPAEARREFEQALAAFAAARAGAPAPAPAAAASATVSAPASTPPSTPA